MKNLQRIRKEKGLSQSELSERSHVKLQNIRFYESGERDINNAEARNVYKLSKALNVSMEELLELEALEKGV